MSTDLRFDQIRLPGECDKLRTEVRAFIAEEVAAGTFAPDRPGHGDSHDRAFSRRVGAKGWIGMTWPKKYGGTHQAGHPAPHLPRRIVLRYRHERAGLRLGPVRR
jgi:acyl-CoA dehydrogenase